MWGRLWRVLWLFFDSFWVECGNSRKVSIADMKSPDVRFLAWSIFALALSLPGGAWIWSGRIATQSLPVTARSVPAVLTVPSSPRYQIATQDHFVYRIDTETGKVQYFSGALSGWVALDKDNTLTQSGGVAIKDR